MGIRNTLKIDKSKKDNIKLIIARENAAKPFDTAKKPLRLLALLVQLFSIVPRIFVIAFGRNNRYILLPSFKLGNNT